MSVRELVAALALVVAIFGAGGAWTGMVLAVKRLRGDLNGAMKKADERMKKMEKDSENQRLALLEIAPPKKRDELFARFWKD